MTTSYTNIFAISPLHCTKHNIKINKLAPKFPSNSSPSQSVICFRRPPPRLSSKKISAAPTASSSMATGDAEEFLPPALDSSSEPPPLFDGTTRLYISYNCPYAQRVWIARNYKGLQEKIKLVPIDLENRPAWYKKKVYLPNKVPSLEHDNEVRGESLDLLKYVDNCFEGPDLYPDDHTKRERAEELLSYTEAFNRVALSSLKRESLRLMSNAFDYLEAILFKFSDGPFFLGQFSLVDIAYAPFIERFHPLLLDVKNYDVTAGRPMLTSWIEEMDKIEAYRQTKLDPQEIVTDLKKRFSIN